MPEPVLVLGQEVDEPPLVDGDEPGLVRGPARRRPALERPRSPRSTSSLALFSSSWLPSLFVRKRLSVEHERPRRWGAARSAGGDLVRCDLLDERGLAVAGVAGDDDESELPAEHLGD